MRLSTFSLRALLLLALAVTAIGGSAALVRPAAEAVATTSAAKGDYVPGQVIVKLGSTGSTSALSAAGQALGLGHMRELIAGSGQYILSSAGAAVNVPAAVTSLAAMPGVVSASPDYLLHADRVPNDALYADNQWYLPLIHAPEAWDITTGSAGIVIAGIDTGVSNTHPDLTGKLLPGFNAITGGGDFNDDNGHGTMTSGLFAADSNNGQGIAGVCWACKILPVKILNSEGGGSVSNFAVGIHWAVDHGARVLNISAGVDFEVDSMAEAVQYAHDRNVVVVASAGNTPDGKPRYPAGYPTVIAVGATARNDTTTGFSSYGPYVDLSAPGVGILSTIKKGASDTYDYANGTSFSSPLTAGAVGLMLSLNPGLTPEQVQAVLETSADDIESPGWDDLSGWGRLNVVKALQTVQSGNIPALPVVPVTTPGQPTPVSPTVGGSTIRGTVTGVTPANVQVSLSPANPAVAPRTVQLADNGTYSFTDLPAGKYTVGLLIRGGTAAPAPQQVEVDGQGATVKEVNFTVGGSGGNTGGTGAQPGGPRPAAFDRVAQPANLNGQYFEATGHTLSGAFLNYWQQYGGLPIFGYPLSEPFQEISSTDGKAYTVQYFERNRFELHPENSAPNDVLLGLLGRTVTAGRAFAPGTPITEDANHRFFTATQHSLSDAFLSYWNAHGGLAIFGYPISEPVMEQNTADGKQYLVQYFERNRFELHPEFAGTPNEVQLGLLGNEVLKARGWK